VLHHNFVLKRLLDGLEEERVYKASTPERYGTILAVAEQLSRDL